MTSATIVVVLVTVIEIVLEYLPEMFGVSNVVNLYIFNVSAHYQREIGFVVHQTILFEIGKIN